MLPPDGGPEFNRLIHEKSPYLLQHARNPVDWYPWGDEAFERARREKKPVFLSVGYSTCHWCHVMERESFERHDVADILNRHFVAVKVDREERPDVDAIYMTVTQLMTGRGGWPNSVWLTPARRPWFAGTYFPREDASGRPGFKSVLTQLAAAWQDRRSEVDRQADRITQALKQAGTGRDFTATGELARDVVGAAMRAIVESFDPTHGGLGGAPKFPPHGALRLLAYECRRTPDPERLRILTRTLDAMADGGIHDHVGGGFHRYATDARWFLPHFEKMLYDNAQLARAYVDGFLLTGHTRYRRVAMRTLDWVLREMTDADGAFHSAIDADSEGEEGKFYAWRPEEVVAVLGDDAGQRFCRVYGIEPGGNFADEAGGHKPGTSIVHLKRPLGAAAAAERISVDQLRRHLDADRRKLLEHRATRVWPHIDDKVLTAWNGLTIGSLAYAGRHLNQPRYTHAAERAAAFILDRMRRDARLLHTYRAGHARLSAYLDDYAFLADGLLELHDATGHTRWLDQARALMDVLVKHHWDAPTGGFFFVSDDHEDLLTRTKDPFDSALPSGNGVAAAVLVRLGALTGETAYGDQARAALDAFRGFMQQAPRGTESLILAAARWLDQPSAAPATRAAGTQAAGSQPDARSTIGAVTVRAFAPTRTPARGQTVALIVRVALDRGWHVNSSAPLDPRLVALRVTLDAHPHAALGHVVYPPGNEVRLPFSPERLSVYEGTIDITVPVVVGAAAPPGPTRWVLRLRAQPCDDRSCQAPQTHALPIPIEIAP